MIRPLMIAIGTNTISAAGMSSPAWSRYTSRTRWRTFPKSSFSFMGRESTPMGGWVEDNGGSMPDLLRGQLLIASPSLYDYFRRTVVLVLEHNEEGAMGVILNRPSETTVGDAVSALAGLTDDDEVVRVGGPVSPEAVVALGDFDDP